MYNLCLTQISSFAIEFSLSKFKLPLFDLLIVVTHWLRCQEAVTSPHSMTHTAVISAAHEGLVGAFGDTHPLLVEALSALRAEVLLIGHQTLLGGCRLDSHYLLDRCDRVVVVSD